MHDPLIVPVRSSFLFEAAPNAQKKHVRNFEFPETLVWDALAGHELALHIWRHRRRVLLLISLFLAVVLLIILFFRVQSGLISLGSFWLLVKHSLLKSEKGGHQSSIHGE